MGRQRIDTVLRVRSRHRPGQLARLATVIAQEGALIGEITTVHMAEGLSTRDITVETENEEHTGRLIAALGPASAPPLLRALVRSLVKQTREDLIPEFAR